MWRVGGVGGWERRESILPVGGGEGRAREDIVGWGRGGGGVVLGTQRGIIRESNVLKYEMLASSTRHKLYS